MLILKMLRQAQHDVDNTITYQQTNDNVTSPVVTLSPSKGFLKLFLFMKTKYSHF